MGLDSVTRLVLTTLDILFRFAKPPINLLYFQWFTEKIPLNNLAV